MPLVKDLTLPQALENEVSCRGALFSHWHIAPGQAVVDEVEGGLNFE
jgi:hypothetical protein